MQGQRRRQQQQQGGMLGTLVQGLDTRALAAAAAAAERQVMAAAAMEQAAAKLLKPAAAAAAVQQDKAMITAAAAAANHWIGVISAAAKPWTLAVSYQMTRMAKPAAAACSWSLVPLQIALYWSFRRCIWTVQKQQNTSVLQSLQPHR
jgi:hypothetical protein